MNTARIKRLRQIATDAIEQYNNEVAGGAEPVYPAWATDALLVMAGMDQMAAALKEARKHVPGRRAAVLMMIDKALN